MNIDLGKEWESFIEEQVNCGRYRCADDVIRDGLRLLVTIEPTVEESGEAFLRAVDEGVDALNRGDYVEIAREDLQEYFDRIKARGRERLSGANSLPSQ